MCACPGPLTLSLLRARHITYALFLACALPNNHLLRVSTSHTPPACSADTVRESHGQSRSGGDFAWDSQQRPQKHHCVPSPRRRRTPAGCGRRRGPETAGAHRHGRPPGLVARGAGRRASHVELALSGSVATAGHDQRHGFTSSVHRPVACLRWHTRQHRGRARAGHC